MSKRFTDSEKWKKPFIRSMKAPYKLLWLYILDECNHAGIWQVDFDVAQLKIGEKLRMDQALEFFKDKIIVFDNSEKWFLPDFIEFQYGELNPANRAHNSIISILKKYSLIDDLYKIKPLISPLQGAKEKSIKNKEMDMDKETIQNVSQIQKNFTEYPNQILEGWQKLEAWINLNTPRIQQMRKPITIDNYSGNADKYDSDLGREKLLAMQNKQTLLKDYIDAHLTFTSWYNNYSKQNGNTYNSNKRANPSERFNVTSNETAGPKLGTKLVSKNG